MHCEKSPQRNISTKLPDGEDGQETLNAPNGGNLSIGDVAMVKYYDVDPSARMVDMASIFIVIW